MMIKGNGECVGFQVQQTRCSTEAAMRVVLSSILTVAILIGTAFAFPSDEVPTSEAAYIAKVKTAAPEQIVAKATIVMVQDGKSRPLQTGTNGFTCLIRGDGTPLCADENGLAWENAVASQSAPPNKTGFIYMLAGDAGTSNHDPHQRATHQHWVQTGPHVMIVGPIVREMPGYPRNADVPDPTQPFVMYPGTPYAHLMLPVTSTK
jgi:hypothetical protein